ncbi:hypothetical protein [Hungatella effluvii]|uniref:hypothetical protein n=1 Tax=Hungatella effluvii TaxID=1096246 RepID=UPI0022E60592|nr:hypothetical protein [Hungatella effluvii]
MKYDTRYHDLQRMVAAGLDGIEEGADRQIIQANLLGYIHKYFRPRNRRREVSMKRLVRMIVQCTLLSLLFGSLTLITRAAASYGYPEYIPAAVLSIIITLYLYRKDLTKHGKKTNR